MAIDKGYTPTIGSGGTDNGEVTKRLNDPNDTFPYTESEDGIIAEEAFVETTFFEQDRFICKLMFTGLQLGEQVQLYTKLQNRIVEYGDTQYIRSISSQVLNKEISSAQEALDETHATLSKIFVKISEYITTVISVMDKWIRTSSDLQKRSLQSLEKLSGIQTIPSGIFDLKAGGTPAYNNLAVAIMACNNLLNKLGDIDKDNTAVVFISKFIKLINELTENREPSDSEFEKMITSDVVFDNLPELQDLFTAIGITFDGNEAASFGDKLQYEPKGLVELGYTTDSFTKLIKICPTSESIIKCKVFLQVLQRLNTLFKSVKNIDTLDESSVDKFKTILENLPNILTLVVGIYRSSIVASRYYTTLLQELLTSIHEHKG